MMSANQKYKNSGTSQPFKDWLVEEQKKGELSIHDENSFRNAVGENTLNKSNKIRNRNILIGIGVSLAVYGLYRMYKSKNESVNTEI